MTGMEWLGRLVMQGYRIETVISTQPGFELITLISPSGERVLYWKRSSVVTLESVNHLKKLVKVRVDKLVIEFTDKPAIDLRAEEELRKLFKQVEVHTSKETEPRLEVVELYGGDVVLLKRKKTRGQLRLFEADRVQAVLNQLGNDKLWLLIIEVKKDGKVVISDEYKSELWNHIQRAINEGSKIVVLAVWHGNYSTDIFLLWPQPQKQT